MKPARRRSSLSIRRTASAVVVLISLVAVVLFTAQPQAVAGGDPTTIVINNTVDGDPNAVPFEYVISPEVDGCTAEQTVEIDGAGGQVTVFVAPAVAGPIQFDSSDFTVTPVFSDVQDFDFSIGVDAIAAGTAYTNPDFDLLEYSVFGSLDNTPSGFPAFNLVRSILFADFVAQGSSLTLETMIGADLSDGLQVSELAGTDDVFELNAREVGTGRYHPALLTLRGDGTGRIQNSNNQGGINPASLEEVDVDFGEEYITDLAFEPRVLTLAPGIPCTYTVSQQPDVDFLAEPDSITGVTTGTEVDFTSEARPKFCNGAEVTIDMNTNGGNGLGTAGDDVILGTAGDDMIDAAGGDDTVCAGDGNDVVIGGAGNDTMFGGDGNDLIRGNSGQDTLVGQDGNDRLLGGVDGDRIDGGFGDDYLGGFGGDDSLDGNLGNDTIFGGFGQDVIDGGLGDDVIRGLIGDDLIAGGPGDDILDGDRGNDQMSGGPGDDVMRGGNANDRISGDEGDDSVNGGKGDDTLIGGDGTGDACSGNKENTADTADASCEFIFGVP